MFFFQEEVGKFKKAYDNKQLLKHMPAEFKEFLEHIDSLEYADKPDYNVRFFVFIIISNCMYRL